MAEYTEVIKYFKRMCWYYSRNKEQKSCPICTSYPNCNIGQCRKIAFEQPTCFEDVVMSWAAEHPEPVYPTWLEWLHTTSAVDDTIDIPVGDGTIFRVAIKNVPIPADIAEKLGIEPKK